MKSQLNMSPSPAQIAQLETQTEIAAMPGRVWQELTHNINDWWPNEFFTGGRAGSRAFILEPQPGGRMYETWDDGGGVLWATVVALQPNECLHMFGSQFPGWGGPNVWFGSWEVEPSDGGTLITYTESIVGQVSENHVAQKTTGWAFLWQCLKASVEGSKPPTWETGG